MITNEEKKEFDKVIYFLSRCQSNFAKSAAISAIRGFCNLTPPKRASKKALEKAKKMGINLGNTDWYDQKKFDPDRKIFHYEHLWTCTDVFKLCKSAKTESNVSEILDKLEVIWILKEENKKLKKSKRENPLEEYRKAEIELVNI